MNPDVTGKPTSFLSHSGVRIGGRRKDQGERRSLETARGERRSLETATVMG